MPKTYNPIEAAEAQKHYCDRQEVPLYAPANGWCSRCGRNIYEPYTYRGKEEQTYGISVDEAGSRLITSCPHCNYSFVE